MKATQSMAVVAVLALVAGAGCKQRPTQFDP